MSIIVERNADGLAFGVKAQAGARKNAIRGEHDGCLKVAVTQAPEKGRANQAIIEVLCESLGLRRNQVTLIAGEANSRKKFLVREIAADELSQRLAAVVDAA